MNIKNTGVWRFFSSIKLAIWLLGVISFCSLIGTLIPQGETSEFYISKVGQVGYDLIMRAGFDRLYYSWWFILFLFALALNLAVCLVNKLPLRAVKLGSFISHLSILVILLGAAIGLVFGEKEYVAIDKGKAINSFVYKGRSVDLGFSLRLDDFVYTEHIDPKEKLLVCESDSGAETHGGMGAHAGMAMPGNGPKVIAEVPTDVGVETAVADTGYRVKILRYLPDFAMDTATKTATSRSFEPNNPAVEVQFTDKAGKVSRFWVFARFPDMHQKTDQNFRFLYRWVGRMPKDYISRVTVLKGTTEVVKKDIRVNEPLSYGGYKFFQSSYDTEALNWTGLQVVRDPGVPVVYAGFLLLIAGVIIIFYVNPVVKRS
ncbi:MAG: cytochrome c biogenesis protein ResB [Candidatus Omnitrophica bacterium]|nr:cytochrome c biogenesis protein ResB [Candidatus Omnitrophota bacterium]